MGEKLTSPRADLQREPWAAGGSPSSGHKRAAPAQVMPWPSFLLEGRGISRSCLVILGSLGLFLSLPSVTTGHHNLLGPVGEPLHFIGRNTDLRMCTDPVSAASVLTHMCTCTRKLRCTRCVLTAHLQVHAATRDNVPSSEPTSLLQASRWSPGQTLAGADACTSAVRKVSGHVT